MQLMLMLMILAATKHCWYTTLRSLSTGVTNPFQQSCTPDSFFLAYKEFFLPWWRTLHLSLLNFTRLANGSMDLQLETSSSVLRVTALEHIDWTTKFSGNCKHFHPLQTVDKKKIKQQGWMTDPCSTLLLNSLWIGYNKWKKLYTYTKNSGFMFDLINHLENP